jgi:hypothetical protein
MSTTTATSPQSEEARTRSQKIALYVALEALDLVLIEFVNGGPFTDIPEFEGIDIDSLAVHLPTGERVRSTDGSYLPAPETSALDLARELWPEDPDAGDIPRENRPEWRLAEAMSQALQARLFSALRDKDEWFARMTTRELKQTTWHLESFIHEMPLGGQIERYYADPEYRATMPCGECGTVGGCEHFPKEGNDA